ncbi:MAG: hypothetical protein K2X47_00940 [Bdellovibrionales bacterium]|nr:hypothetical protein [Bdellovibrionales bacterium]
MMTRKFFHRLAALIFTWLTLTPALSSAEELDTASQEALKKTIELLNSPELRADAIQDGRAKAADKAVSNVSGGNATIKNDIYSLSSVLFERIVNESKGDTQKMNQLLMDAQRDPASFAEKYLPPGSPEASKLQELAAQAQSARQPPHVRKVKP